MSRKVLMLAPSHYAGEPLNPGDMPTLPDDVADRLVERGRATDDLGHLAPADPAPSPRPPRAPRNRGADAVTGAPAADPGGDDLPEIEPESDPA